MNDDNSDAEEEVMEDVIEDSGGSGGGDGETLLTRIIDGNADRATILGRGGEDFSESFKLANIDNTTTDHQMLERIVFTQSSIDRVKGIESPQLILQRGDVQLAAHNYELEVDQFKDENQRQLNERLTRQKRKEIPAMEEMYNNNHRNMLQVDFMFAQSGKIAGDRNADKDAWADIGAQLANFKTQFEESKIWQPDVKHHPGLVQLRLGVELNSITRQLGATIEKESWNDSVSKFIAINVTNNDALSEDQKFQLKTNNIIGFGDALQFAQTESDKIPNSWMHSLDSKQTQHAEYVKLNLQKGKAQSRERFKTFMGNAELYQAMQSMAAKLDEHGAGKNQNNLFASATSNFDISRQVDKFNALQTAVARADSSSRKAAKSIDAITTIARNQAALIQHSKQHSSAVSNFLSTSYTSNQRENQKKKEQQEETQAQVEVEVEVGVDQKDEEDMQIDKDITLPPPAEPAEEKKEEESAEEEVVVAQKQHIPFPAPLPAETVEPVFVSKFLTQWLRQGLKKNIAPSEALQSALLDLSEEDLQVTQNLGTNLLAHLSASAKPADKNIDHPNVPEDAPPPLPPPNEKKLNKWLNQKSKISDEELISKFVLAQIEQERQSAESQSESEPEQVQPNKGEVKKGRLASLLSKFAQPISEKKVNVKGTGLAKKLVLGGGAAAAAFGLFALSNSTGLLSSEISNIQKLRFGAVAGAGAGLFYMAGAIPGVSAASAVAIDAHEEHLSRTAADDIRRESTAQGIKEFEDWKAQNLKVEEKIELDNNDEVKNQATEGANQYSQREIKSNNKVSDFSYQDSSTPISQKQYEAKADSTNATYFNGAGSVIAFWSAENWQSASVQPMLTITVPKVYAAVAEFTAGGTIDLSVADAGVQDLIIGQDSKVYNSDMTPHKVYRDLKDLPQVQMQQIYGSGTLQANTVETNIGQHKVEVYKLDLDFLKNEHSPQTNLDYHIVTPNSTLANRAAFDPVKQIKNHQAQTEILGKVPGSFNYESGPSSADTSAYTHNNPQTVQKLKTHLVQTSLRDSIGAFQKVMVDQIFVGLQRFKDQGTAASIEILNKFLVQSVKIASVEQTAQKLEKKIATQLGFKDFDSIDFDEQNMDLVHDMLATQKYEMDMPNAVRTYLQEQLDKPLLSSEDRMQTSSTFNTQRHRPNISMKSDTLQKAKDQPADLQLTSHDHAVSDGSALWQHVSDEQLKTALPGLGVYYGQIAKTIFQSQTNYQSAKELVRYVDKDSAEQTAHHNTFSMPKVGTYEPQGGIIPKIFSTEESRAQAGLLSKIQTRNKDVQLECTKLADTVRKSVSSEETLHIMTQEVYTFLHPETQSQPYQSKEVSGYKAVFTDLLTGMGDVAQKYDMTPQAVMAQCEIQGFGFQLPNEIAGTDGKVDLTINNTFFFPTGTINRHEFIKISENMTVADLTPALHNAAETNEQLSIFIPQIDNRRVFWDDSTQPTILPTSNGMLEKISRFMTPARLAEYSVHNYQEQSVSNAEQIMNTYMPVVSGQPLTVGQFQKYFSGDTASIAAAKVFTGASKGQTQSWSLRTDRDSNEKGNRDPRSFVPHKVQEQTPEQIAARNALDIQAITEPELAFDHIFNALPDDDPAPQPVVPAPIPGAVKPVDQNVDHPGQEDQHSSLFQPEEEMIISSRSDRRKEDAAKIIKWSFKNEFRHSSKVPRNDRQALRRQAEEDDANVMGKYLTNLSQSVSEETKMHAFESAENNVLHGGPEFVPLVDHNNDDIVVANQAFGNPEPPPIEEPGLVDDPKYVRGNMHDAKPGSDFAEIYNSKSFKQVTAFNKAIDMSKASASQVALEFNYAPQFSRITRQNREDMWQFQDQRLNELATRTSELLPDMHELQQLEVEIDKLLAYSLSSSFEHQKDLEQGNTKILTPQVLTTLSKATKHFKNQILYDYMWAGTTLKDFQQSGAKLSASDLSNIDVYLKAGFQSFGNSLTQAGLANMMVNAGIAAGVGVALGAAALPAAIAGGAALFFTDMYSAITGAKEAIISIEDGVVTKAYQQFQDLAINSRDQATSLMALAEGYVTTNIGINEQNIKLKATATTKKIQSNVQISKEDINSNVRIQLGLRTASETNVWLDAKVKQDEKVFEKEFQFKTSKQFADVEAANRTHMTHLIFGGLAALAGIGTSLHRWWQSRIKQKNITDTISRDADLLASAEALKDVRLEKENQNKKEVVERADEIKDDRVQKNIDLNHMLLQESIEDRDKRDQAIFEKDLYAANLKNQAIRDAKMESIYYQAQLRAPSSSGGGSGGSGGGRKGGGEGGGEQSRWSSGALGQHIAQSANGVNRANGQISKAKKVLDSSKLNNLSKKVRDFLSSRKSKSPASSSSKTYTAAMLISLTRDFLKNGLHFEQSAAELEQFIRQWTRQEPKMMHALINDLTSAEAGAAADRTLERILLKLASMVISKLKADQ